MKREPRNVPGYHVQQPPDGCHNCASRYYGMVRWPGNQPIVSCKLACLTPERPAFCDEVEPMGKCDSWTANAPDEARCKASPPAGCSAPASYWGPDGRCIHCGAGNDAHHSYTCQTNMHPDKREPNNVLTVSGGREKTYGQ